MSRRLSAVAGSLLFLCMALSLTDCAGPGGVSGADDGREDGVIAPGRGRIYFYRTALSVGGANSIFGNAVAPAVLLDGRRAGEALPGGVFFCDVKSGWHEIAVREPDESLLNVEVAAGAAHYVRMDWGLATLMARSHLREVDVSTGKAETEHRTRVAATCPD